MNKRLLKLLKKFRFEDPEHVISILGEDMVKTKLLEMLAMITERPDFVLAFTLYYNLEGKGIMTHAEVAKKLNRQIGGSRAQHMVSLTARMLRQNPTRRAVLRSAYEEACRKN